MRIRSYHHSPEMQIQADMSVIEARLIVDALELLNPDAPEREDAAYLLAAHFRAAIRRFAETQPQPVKGPK